MDKRELDDGEERPRAGRPSEQRTHLRLLFGVLRQHGVERASFHPDGQLARVRFAPQAAPASVPLPPERPAPTSALGNSFVASGTAPTPPPQAPSAPAPSPDFLAGPEDEDDLTFASTPGRLVARSRLADPVPQDRDA